MGTRSRFCRAFGLIFPMLIIGAVTSMPSLAAEKLRFGSSVRGHPNYDMPMMAAAEKGIWKEIGLEVEWTPFRAGGELMRALAARALDMVTTGASTSILATSRQVPVTIVADPKEPLTFYFQVLKNSPIKEAKDLKGAKIGILRFGGTSHNYGRAVARALRMEGDMKFVAGGGVVDELAALKAGSLNARIASFFDSPALVIRGEVRSVLAIKEHLPREFMEQVATAHREVIQRNPEIIRRGVKGFIQGGDYVVKDRAWALAKLKAGLGVSEEEAAAIYPQVSFNREGGRIRERAVENVRNFLVEFGVIPKDKAPPLEELYSARFTE